MMERLHKFMARAGIGSRRYCEELIKAGRVKVNGHVVTELGTKIDPDEDIVEVDNKKLKLKEEKIYLILNKPAGFITSTIDKFGRPTIFDLLGGVSDRIFSVGRLDFETEGLLLLTNDGELAFRLTHPRYKVRKKYLAEVSGHPSDLALDQIRKGVTLEDGVTAPAEVSVLRQTRTSTFVNIVIHEGKKRQIRRMFQVIGHTVKFLKRISIGNITLGNLPLGNFRTLTEKEVDSLYRSVRMK